MLRSLWILGIGAALGAAGTVGVCGAAEVLPASVRACAAETDATRRLACYDREVGRFTAVQPAPGSTARAAAAPTAATPTGAPGAEAPDVSKVPSSAAPNLEDQFGVSGELERKRKEQKPTPGLTQLNSRIAAISTRPHAGVVVRLEDGQVWEQAHEEDQAELSVGDAVTIRRGAMGSYWLDSTAGHSLRVRRTH
jgi:hypothetical protein